MAMTRSEMDRRIDEHFGYEANDDVEGVLATLAPDAEHDIVGWPSGPTRGRSRTSGSTSARSLASCRKAEMATAARAERPNQKRRTRKDLLLAAARLLQQGKRPSLEEVAEAALVSRATAYRYFPGVEPLLVEAAEKSR